MHKNDLIDKTEIQVRFHEVDSMNVVWHGNYVNYLEYGRESFGEKYGINYMDFYKNKILTPIVNLELNYKKSLKYGDKFVVETRYVDCDAAKLIFKYVIYRLSDHEVVATGKSIQVFLNTKKELLLTIPQFFLEWKEKWKII